MPKVLRQYKYIFLFCRQSKIKAVVSDRNVSLTLLLFYFLFDFMITQDRLSIHVPLTLRRPCH